MMQQANTAFTRLGAASLGLVAVAAFATLAISADAAINSNLRIEAGQTFELGGGQVGGFTVTGRNTGPVAVLVQGKVEGASQAAVRGAVAPGARLEADFGPGEMALLRNTSDREVAKLQLKITGDTSSLGMGYSPNR